MTPRGVGLLLGGIGAAVGGWFAGWPELTALGAIAVTLVVLVLLTLSRGIKVGLTVDATSMRVVRGEHASVRVSLSSRGRRRALRLVEGAVRQPVRTVPVRGGRSREIVLDVPVSTAKRGLHPLGPFTVVRGDPWSIVRASVGSAPEGTLLVRPRTHPVRRGFATREQVGDAEAMTRRRGEDHFFALRDYVLGDEPRNVHWRSSARSGKLVVRQKVAAAVDGVLIVLDTDSTAYASVDAFSAGFVEERFEEAVEVAASLCLARAEGGQQVHLATTSRHQPRIAPGAGVSSFIDALAVVAHTLPVDTHAAEIPALARKARCSHVIVVTGTPSADLVSTLRRCGGLGPVLIRVGGEPSGPVAGATTVDVTDVAAMA